MLVRHSHINKLRLKLKDRKLEKMFYRAKYVDQAFIGHFGKGKRIERKAKWITAIECDQFHCDMTSIKTAILLKFRIV